jgi:hypothetical protein
MRWEERLAYVVEVIKAYKIFIGKIEERDHSEERGVGGIRPIVLKWY